MRRREVVALIGGAATTWPFAASAQQSAVPEIGFLGSTSYSEWAHLVSAFRRGLGETGYVDGRNVALAYHWADGQYDRLAAGAANLVGRRVAGILAAGGAISALTAKAATATIPIIFVIGGDPVEIGLVATLNQPGGNVTGVSFLLNALVGKRLELLHHLVPTTTTIGVLVNPRNPNTVSDFKKVAAAAGALGLKVRLVNASSEDELIPAFNSLLEQRATALLMFPDPSFISWRDRIVALAAAHSMPAAYPVREYVDAGGLMSYGTSVTDAYWQAGIYAGRILKGESPAKLPVLQSTKFELVLNLATAKALGLTIPPTLLASADEVIE